MDFESIASAYSATSAYNLHSLFNVSSAQAHGRDDRIWTCDLCNPNAAPYTTGLHLDNIEPKDLHLWEQWSGSHLQLLPTVFRLLLWDKVTNLSQSVTLFFHIDKLGGYKDSNLLSARFPELCYSITPNPLKNNYLYTVIVNMALYSLLNYNYHISCSSNSI